MDRRAARRPDVDVEPRLQYHLHDFPAEKPKKLIFLREIRTQNDGPVAVPACQVQRRVRVDRSPVGRVGRHQLGVALQQEADRVDPAQEKNQGRC